MQALLLAAIAIVLPGSASLAQEALESPPAEPRPAEVEPLADESLILHVIATDAGYVAVGERGHILTSADGAEWIQSDQVPASATLTRVAHADGHLWAVGHDTTILHSADGGTDWELQFFDPELEQPLLDVLFFDAANGLAIGAYGLFMVTSDGGTIWDTLDMTELVTRELFDPEALVAAAAAEDDYAAQFADLGCYEFKECHLNAIAALDDGRLVIVAERGFGYRSADGGASWEAFRLPYGGSMFGVAVTDDDCLLAFGLRGHAYLSCDFAESWQRVPTGTESSLFGGAAGPDGVVLVGANGTVLRGPTPGALSADPHPEADDLAAVAMAPKGLILAGEEGIWLDVPAERPATESTHE